MGAPGSEAASSSAYPGFLLGLLATLKHRFDDRELDEILTETGRRLARANGLPAARDFKTNLAAAMAVVDSLGAHTEAFPDGDAIMVRNYSC